MDNNQEKKNRYHFNISGVRAKIIIPSILIFFLSMVIVAAITYSSQTGITRKQILHAAETNNEQIQSLIQYNNNSKEAFSQELARNRKRILLLLASLIRENPKQTLQSNFLSTLAEKLEIDEIHISDANGILRWSNKPKLINFNFKSSEQSAAFLPALKNKDFFLMQEVMKRGADKKLFQYSGIARQDKSGIIQIGLKASEFQASLGKSSLTSLIGSIKLENNFVIISSNSGEILTVKNTPAEIQSFSETKLWKLRKKIKGKPSIFSFQDEEYGIACSQNDQIFIFTGINLDEYKINSALLLLTMALVILLALGLSGLAVIFISHLVIIKPIFSLSFNMRNAADGDLTQRNLIISHDEIGQMGRDLNMLLDSFSAIVKSSSKLLGNLKSSVQNMSVGTQEVSATANEQAAAVKEIVTTMEDSDQLSRSVSDKASQVSLAFKESIELINKGYHYIKENQDTMDLIKDSNSESIQEMKILQERVKAIWDIVNIINGIADQTKIIAFNAELEAAAAGTAGSNFQIVASEIRRLADSTVSSTQEIKTKINEIQNTSDSLLLSSENGTKRVNQGWELSQHLNSVFNNIQQSAESSSKSVDEISLSIKQQVAGFEQILQTLKQISAGIENFTESTQSTSHEAKNIQKQVEEISLEISHYKFQEDDKNLEEENFEYGEYDDENTNDKADIW